MDAPLQLLVTNLDYDEHKGRIAIGRLQAGTLRKGESVVFTKPGAEACFGRALLAMDHGMLVGQSEGESVVFTKPRVRGLAPAWFPVLAASN